MLQLHLKTVLLGAASLAIATPTKRADPQGIDVSGYQSGIDWDSVASNGVSFAYIKATEGTTYKSSSFSDQYTGATNAGLIRGAYHFARPDTSTGAAQAKFFAKHGGGWTADGVTLPGALDMEYNPYGDTCYGLTASAMVDWIQDFSDTYQAATSSWWTSCTGDSSAFSANSPLWVARYASSVGSLPSGWSFHTFWQYADSGSNPGDQDVFNGDAAGLSRCVAAASTITLALT
ncbi:glycoside hydrolase family 25 protein [Schizophyllum amplum]|uniref:N,O-diacetylmuramidase n=1 Tax=Schizophyllum amplum TaxID=97359 RepID=A0A550CBZ8_9AGAR|nr:glycoside hydrolase family 25 protein [Auriculariopsis ampla]